MSSKRKKKQGAPMSSAGLVRFYEEENLGLKLKPGYIIAVSAVFAVVIALAHFGLL
ncbi:MAG: preprotein translocase subunit Sec61beta [Thermoprotei archaeon]